MESQSISMESLESIYQKYLQYPNIVTDSRLAVPDCIYWGIKGERFDGSSFCKDALDKGARYCVIDNFDYYHDSEQIILIENSLKTLQDLAQHHRSLLTIPVLAITGSNGKTTTKELTQLVLSQGLNTFSTPGNLNNHIGLPLSLLKVSTNHQIAILELGANHQQEHQFLLEICQPSHYVITNIGLDHLEGFGGFEGVIKATKEVTDDLIHRNGILFNNLDDQEIQNLVKKYSNTVNYSLEGANGTDLIECMDVNLYPFLTVKLKFQAEEVEIYSHLFGQFNAINIILASTIGVYFGISLSECKRAIEYYIPTNNRSQRIKIDTNEYILDAYNANPSSMSLGIVDFQNYPHPNKFLILGDMFELGKASENEHKKIIELIDTNQYNMVIFVGQIFKNCLNSGLLANQFVFDSTLDSKEFLKEQNIKNGLFYLKGSRGMKLETLLNT